MSRYPELERLQALSFAHVNSRIFFAALHLDIFNRIGEHSRSAPQIADATGASPRGIRMLLDCLVSLELLRKTSGGEYALAPAAAQYLLRGGQDYIGSMWEEGAPLKFWDSLEPAIESGRPAGPAGAGDFPGSSTGLVRTLEVVHRESARRAAQILSAGCTEMEVLDVACGSGVWGIAIGVANPASRITAQDLPEVLDVTREYARRNGVESRMQYLPGDLRQLAFPENRYDLAIAANVAHWIGERCTRDLLRRLHESLKAGGRIAIIDVMPNDDRTGPPAHLAFALTLLIGTQEGDIYTVQEYQQWLTEAGFAGVATAEMGSYSPLIIGRK